MENISENLIPSAGRVKRNIAAQLTNLQAGNTFTDTLYNGREVTFTARIIPADKVEGFTFVSAVNERDQHRLDENSLDDILPSIRKNGMTTWAVGRQSEIGPIEVADGSRRRMSCILSQRDYKILTADLTDDEMEMYSIMGNFHKQPSAIEKGRRYRRLACKLGSGRKSEEFLSEMGEKVSRRVITRCIKAAELPKVIVSLYHNINDLSADMAEAIHRYAFKELEPEEGRIDDDANISPYMFAAYRSVVADHSMSAQELTNYLVEFCKERAGLTSKKEPKPAPLKRSYGGGKISVTDADKRFTIDIAELTNNQKQEIEQFLSLMFNLNKDE